jgi:hypothetical protein
METHERARIETLLDRDEKLRALWREHLEYERKLADFETLRHLTPQEELDRKQLQKLKLRGKTEIARILASYDAS